MERNVILKDGGRKRQMTLPVTPESFIVSTGRSVETVNLHEVGDVNLPAGRTLDAVSIDCVFPASARSYALADREPYEYVAQIEDWIERKKVLRLVVTNTGINRPVLIESVSYGEQDGTNDVYATISLREYREINIEEVISTAAAQSAARSAEDGAPEKEQSYRAVYGDCLCAICRKYYGDGSYALAKKLAAYNSRPDPNILYVGEVLRIPPRDWL